MFRQPLTLSIVAALLVGSLMIVRSEAAESDFQFFEAKIRPVLVEHCYECHSTAAGKSEGGLALDSRSSIRRGGERGPAVVPGDHEKSLLLVAISHGEADLEMPPAKPRLSASVLADFRKWIELGAVDPRDDPTATPAVASVIDSGRDHWAYQSIVDVERPEVSDDAWPRRDLDHFVFAKLESNHLQPSPDADPTTLIRRLHFDVIGLPPSKNRITAFVTMANENGLDAAVEAEVDMLLRSNRYGERWGRHWLDVARFAESSGKETNVTFPHAWRYRNYVIDAFNEDRPYDRFIVEQIAGDLLPWENNQQREELLIATGFLALGAKGLNEMNRIQFLADIADEQIDTVTQAVMASTVACARCHDHKFDPFSMHDYYALAGIFASTQTYFGTSVAPGNQVGGDLLVLPRTKNQVIPNHSFSEEKNKRLREELVALQQESKDRREAARNAVKEGKVPGEFFSLQDALRILWRSGGIEGQLKTVDDDGNALPLAMGVADRQSPIDVPLLERGEIARPGGIVPRGFPAIIQLSSPDIVADQESGRLPLARWLTHPEHPLTARVMVNRIWRHLLGAGIVGSVDNFGVEGETPSHPELLDHLASRFIDNGWSIKSVVREILLSRTYRQSSEYDEESFLLDPENRLLWRHSKRRLDAEAIRDAMLFASGNLNVQRPTSSLIATIGDKPVSLITFDKRVPKDLDGSNHRSVYLPVIRDRLPDVLNLFDFAEPSLVTGDRQTTNVPLQALYLMNSPFVGDQAAQLATRFSEHDRDRQIDELFMVCYGRPPDQQERELGHDFMKTNSLASYCQALLTTAEFRNVD